MASEASVASSQPDQRQLRLIAASAQANESRIRDILEEDPGSWTSVTDQDALRQALQKVAARGKLSIVQFLLAHGADVNPRRDNEVSPLLKAAEGGHAIVVTELLRRRADPNCRNPRSGQTALFAAILKGHNTVVKALLEGGASVDAHDREGRTPLLFLAAEKPGKTKWNVDTIKLLLDNRANLEVKDGIGRTPLLWSATNGNIALMRVLLEYKADLNATNNRGRTALHLAAESNQGESREEAVALLLSYGADPCAVSDGGWTPLHNAAQSGYAPIVQMLLDAGANVNAQLSNGMTPLHWAASNGLEEMVKVLLARPELSLSTKDSFDRTAMLCAAERNNPEIVQLLSPARNADRLSPVAAAACKAFDATIVDFGQFDKKQLVQKCTVHELLYGWDHENDKPKIPTLQKNIKYKPDFRWIHLPANNVSWVETLLAKSFIEAGHRDIEAFKALERCFDQEHHGRYSHAHFMRTFCQRIAARNSDPMEVKREDKPLISVTEEPQEPNLKPEMSGPPLTPRKLSDSFESETPRSEGKKKSRSEQLAERHPKKTKRGKGPPGNPPRRQDSNFSNASNKTSAPLAWETSRFAASNGKIVLFMPFLHYETDERRQRMSDSIREAAERQGLPANPSRDTLLVHAYLNNTRRLHPRRTLDQYFYHGIDTTIRDTDQVVYRYCKHNHIEQKVFMVDQLWLWIIGKDLIITCFPQRWNQPKQDPLNVLDGIIEETNAKTRPPIESVYDLAMLITHRCSGMFDRHRLHDPDYQFLDMFEQSIGVVTDLESQLFSRFNRASEQSTKWLQDHHQRRLGRHSNFFPDIGVETALLVEIKDIRDELGIIAQILDSQLSALGYFESVVTEEVRSEGPRKVTDATVIDIKKHSREQCRGVEDRLKDIDRMDQQAERLYVSLRDLLDLKQKHSNVLEARFAGDQAVIAARQGQTIMVFTIVTIIFLPMSFIAAFFAINLEDWEATPLSAGYVSKYMFGIGLGISIPLIVMAVTFNEIFDAARRLWRELKGLFGGGRLRRNSSLTAELAPGTDLRQILSRLSTSHDDDGPDEKAILSSRVDALHPPRPGRPSLQLSEPRQSRDSRRRIDLTSISTRVQHSRDQSNDYSVHYSAGIGGGGVAGAMSEAARRRRSSAAAGARPRGDSIIGGGGVNSHNHNHNHNQAVSWAARPSMERHQDHARHHSPPNPYQPRRHNLREPDLERGPYSEKP
ncbi:uncharacterized protein B0I36DRAFT_282942 [Microdochium trichocladiopsis]|uniref:Ankyrin repeat-containing domain protein n=1 Tax=Microdochium trichocladiopsis TaxID=1682393 RepID=A0A9P8YDZ4_9PEZI|nr:uncharacterized protein B0I36DRAFT_282942 [Microdochium trichocladiopsis]KAH7037251.1 hypothetical protein B0I36DRAFT_282942 [Microdochium trichocladiopsis]